MMNVIMPSVVAPYSFLSCIFKGHSPLRFVNKSDQPSVFVPDEHFKPSLIFERKEGTYQIGPPSLDFQRLEKDKHVSLLCPVKGLKHLHFL